MRFASFCAHRASFCARAASRRCSLADAEVAAELVEMKLARAPGLMESWSWSWSESQSDELEDELEDEDEEANDDLRCRSEGGASSDVGEEAWEDEADA
jgi:hypothetical protein